MTDIIPFDEFGNLDLDFCASDEADHQFDDGETRVLGAPELDDLDEIDNLTALRLAVPSESPDTAGNRRGRHRSPQPGVVKSRVLIGAMAAGAALAGGYAATHPTGTAAAQRSEPTVEPPASGVVAAGAGRGMQMVTVKAATNVVVYNEELAKGVAFAQERAEREARLQRPLFVMPTRGLFTSNFGYRWGVLHGGVDIANAIGTPIVAASDGVVIEAGPSAGYGMLVKVRHSDGTVTMYGHVNSTTVGVGERVMAGDQIATMGNRGYSTGPHLHFEVLLGGTTRVDPASWLARRGINFGA
ncbi:MAG TPA: M23 family metallopeptidase [Mycobacterium sp.]|nr:M23 family metallopeptidase [Mycobacterium sp.]